MNIATPIKLDQLDKNHIQQCTSKLASSTKKLVMDEYFKLYAVSRRTANLFLTRLDSKGSSKTKFATPAEKYAYECQEAIRIFGINGGTRLFKEKGLTLPKGKTEESTIARMVESDVWAKKLKKKYAQKNSKSTRDTGVVCRGQQAYEPDLSVNNYVHGKKEQRSFLKNQYIVSSDGDEITLAKAADSGVANPVNLHNEMSLRMRDTEEFAKSLGFVQMMYTFTCPSKYHRKKIIKKGKEEFIIDNPKYQKVIKRKNKEGIIEEFENTPRLAQDYLTRVKRLAIAKLKRLGIEYIGVNVVEPQHDGTPHHHLAFFMLPEHRDIVTSVFRHYALQEDGDEAGAKDHRFDALPVKSAASYLMKYIAKGIGAFDIGEDFEAGMDAKDSIIRMSAWKSMWNIRSFGFYGSPSVTVWRELRRLREPLDSSTAEKIRLAADGGHWDMFIKLMREYEVKLLKSDVVDGEGNPVKNKYGETLERVVGLSIKGVSGTELIKTRFKSWFLIDMDKLEQRIISGLPLADRDNMIYVKDVQALIEKAKESKKVRRLYEGTGGIVPNTFTFLPPETGSGSPWRSVNIVSRDEISEKENLKNQEVLETRN